MSQPSEPAPPPAPYPAARRDDGVEPAARPPEAGFEADADAPTPEDAPGAPAARSEGFLGAGGDPAEGRRES